MLVDERLRAIEREHGVFLRSELRELGFDDHAVAVALRCKVWVRVRHGAYCFYDTWVAADETGRHLIRSRAVMRVLGARVALSHVSSLIAQGIPVWGADLSSVHVTRLENGAGRHDADVVHHKGQVRENDLTQASGMNVTVPGRAALEAATMLTVESGLVSVDAVLARGFAHPEELAARQPYFAKWPGAQRLQLVCRLADGRSESPGESRSRYLFWSRGLPAPQLQFEIFGSTGLLIARTDFAWPEYGVLGEFDGKVKYERLLRPGQGAGDVVFEEKQREDRIREATGWTVLRLVWADLNQPDATARRFARYLGRAA